MTALPPVHMFDIWEWEVAAKGEEFIRKTIPHAKENLEAQGWSSWSACTIIWG